MLVVNTTSATLGAGSAAWRWPRKRVPSSRRRNPGRERSIVTIARYGLFASAAGGFFASGDGGAWSGETGDVVDGTAGGGGGGGGALAGGGRTGGPPGGAGAGRVKKKVSVDEDAPPKLAASTPPLPACSRMAPTSTRASTKIRMRRNL